MEDGRAALAAHVNGAEVRKDALDARGQHDEGTKLESGRSDRTFDVGRERSQDQFSPRAIAAAMRCGLLMIATIMSSDAGNFIAGRQWRHDERSPLAKIERN